MAQKLTLKVFLFVIISFFQTIKASKTSKTSTSSTTNEPFKYSAGDNPFGNLYDEYRHKNFIDVTLKLGLKRFEVHRQVLSYSSSVLAKQLKDQRVTTVQLKGQFISSSIINPLLTFFYTSEYNFTFGNVNSTLVAAKHLNVTSLLTGSEQFLTAQLSPTSAFELFVTADNFRLRNLRKLATDYILEHFESVSENPRTLEHSFEDLMLLINELSGRQMSDQIRESILDLLSNWIKHDSARLDSLQNVLQSGNLIDLAAPLLSDDSRSNRDHLCASAFCHSLLHYAFDAASKGRKSTSGIYCFAGTDSAGQYTNVVTHLNPRTGEWRTLGSTKPPARAYATGAVLGDNIHLMGGMTTGNKRLKVNEVYYRSNFTSGLDIPLPEERDAPAAAVLDGVIYLTGGWSKDSTSNSLIRFIPEATHRKWEELAPMLTTRAAHQLVALDGRLFAISGVNELTAEVYDLQTGEWSALPAPNFAHSWFGATAHEGKIYALSSKGFESYDPEIKQWTVLTSPNAYWGTSLMSMNGKLLAIGGCKNDKTYVGEKSVNSYDVKKDKWSKESDMKEGKAYHSCIAV